MRCVVKFLFRYYSRQSASVGVWIFARILFQVCWVVLATRLLGDSGFGELAGIIGLAAIFGGICGLGQGWVMFNSAVGRPSEFVRAWNKAFGAHVATGIALVPLFSIAASFLLDVDLGLTAIAMVAVAEVMAAPLTQLSCFAFASQHRPIVSSAIAAGAAAFRILGAIALWLYSDQMSVAQFCAAHLLSTVCAALFALSLVHSQLGPKWHPTTISEQEWLAGLEYCGTWAGNLSLTSADKVFALNYSGAAVNGLYAVVYRIAGMVSLPMESATTAKTPLIFQQTQRGDLGLSGIWKRTGSYLVFSAFAAGVLLVLSTPIASLFGPAFTPVSDALPLAFPLIALLGVRGLLTNVLLALGSRRLLLLAQSLGITSMAIAFPLLATAHGLAGCLLAIVIAESVFNFSMLLFVHISTRNRCKIKAGE